ncbi:MAG: hypothetical protein WKF79_02670, partial [Nocardioides sp.]
MTSASATWMASRNRLEYGAETLVRHAHRVLDFAGVRISPSKANKIVRDYLRVAEDNDGLNF